MDENVTRDNMNTIKEMILDEQRLVTYISISKDLCIHVNNSKKLLQNIVEDIKKTQLDTKLNVSYIMSGITYDNKARTTVCSEIDVDKTKASFKTLFFIHIYSASKGSSTTVDNVAFLAVNRLEDFPLCTGLIKNNLCVKRSSDEIGKLKTTSQETVQKGQKVTLPPKKAKEEAKSDVRNRIDSKPVVKLQESKSEPAVKTEKHSPKKESASLMKTTDDKKIGHKPQKGIAVFFCKSNSDPGKKSSKEKITIKSEKKVTIENTKVDSKCLDDNKIKTTTKKTSPEAKKSEKMDIDEDIDVDKADTKKQNGITKSKNKSVTQIKKNAKVDKKRKRVLQVSDSESDEDKNPFLDDTPEPEHHESEDEIPPTPSNNIVKITSGIVNPKKRRKIVDKTYTDEDGYILTKKEEVYESCSDNEEIETKENIQTQKIEVKTEVEIEVSSKSKKNGPKATKKKISPPQKGKQATMMSFFKKI